MVSNVVPVSTNTELAYRKVAATDTNVPSGPPSMSVHQVEVSHEQSGTHQVSGAKNEQTKTEQTKTQEPQHKVVYDFDKASHQIWLNVVDPTTGKVLEKLPPESVRKLIDMYSTTEGLPFDKHS